MSDDVVPSLAQAAVSCPGCGSEIAPRLLCCPSCRRLVHGARLKELSEAADDAEDAGDFAGRSVTGTKPYHCFHQRAGSTRSSPGISPVWAAWSRPIRPCAARHKSRRMRRRLPADPHASRRGGWHYRFNRDRRMEAQARRRSASDQGKAPLARVDQGNHGRLDDGIAGSLLDGLRRLAAAGPGGVDLHSRDGARVRTHTIRRSRQCPPVRPGSGSFHPAQTGHGRPKTGCAGRTRRPDLGHGGGARVRPGLPVDVQADLGGHCSASARSSTCSTYFRSGSSTVPMRFAA